MDSVGEEKSYLLSLKQVLVDKFRKLADSAYSIYQQTTAAKRKCIVSKTSIAELSFKCRAILPTAVEPGPFQKCGCNFE